MKMGQVGRIVQARKDASSAGIMDVPVLNPEQSALQVNLRKAIRDAEESLAEVEAGIAGLKTASEQSSVRRETR